MSRLLISIFLFCGNVLVLCSLNAQAVLAKVVDLNNQPLPHARIFFEESGRSTIANENGLFKVEILDSLGSLGIVSKTGFEDEYLDLEGIEDGEIIIRLQTAKRLEANESTLGMSPDSLLQVALSKVEENFPTTQSLLKGFYLEKILDSKDRILMYGEGQIISKKIPYENLNEQNVKGGRPLLSTINFVKGFAEYLPVRLKDKHYLKAAYLKREDCTHMIDKSDVLQWKSSFLSHDGRENYDYKFSNVVSQNGKQIVTINFSPSGKNAFYEGEILINLETLVIEECKYALTSRGLSKINEINPLIFLRKNARHVVYGENEGIYSLNQVHFESEYIYLATGDTLRDRIDYVSTQRYLDVGEGFSNSKRENVGKRLGSLPLEKDYWGKDLTIARTSNVARLFQPSLDIAENKNGFTEASIEFIKAQIKREKKFALIYLQSEACLRCINLDTVFRYAPQYQEAISADYLAFKLPITDKASRSIADLSVFPRLGRQVILSPWGQTLNVKPLTRSVEELTKVLIDLVEAVDLSDLYNKASVAVDLEGEKQLVGEELIKISMKDQVVENKHFGRSLLGAKKTWKERGKRELIYVLVKSTNDKEIQNYFLSHIEEFQNLYTKEELNKIIYSLAFTYPGGRPDFPTISGFLKKYIIGKKDYFLLRAEADFFKLIVPDETIRLEVLIELYQKFQYDEWSDFRLTFLQMILAAETPMDFYNLEGIALSYKPYAVEHEWLDLYSVLLYRSGLEEEGLEMISEVMKKAMEKGINYRPAIYGLRNNK